MFTGIIEETGKVLSVLRRTRSAVLTVSGNVVMRGLKLGDSVAVNGVCLTVSGLSASSFTADVMGETLSRSSLGGLSAGSQVNLERAMPADGRFGGHIVSGHIDGTGVIKSVRKDGNAVWYVISAPEKIMRYIVEKGSVAIDGVSLTVAEVSRESFGVSVIPHTAGNTTLSEKAAGGVVNLENDVIGKYVEKLMGGGAPQGGVTKELLAKFML